MIKISVDLLGGDFAPHAIIDAVTKFHPKDEEVFFIFVGDNASKKLLERAGVANYKFVEAALSLEEGEKYSMEALKTSSLYKAIQQVKLKEADCVVSAGPTMYYFLLSKLILGAINFVNRVPIVGILPSQLDGRFIFLDLGANLEATERDLLIFAIIGKTVSSFLFDKEDPMVGFLNLGKEAGKGPEYINNAMKYYKKFISNNCTFIESEYILEGSCDVVVSNGFIGNCVLKAIEGTIKSYRKMISVVLRKNIFFKFVGAMFNIAMKNNITDKNKFNGGMFVGLNGCVIKSHGSSNSDMYMHCLHFALKMSKIKCQLNERIINEIQKAGLDKKLDIDIKNYIDVVEN